jgi:hypothetical protein
MSYTVTLYSLNVDERNVTKALPVGAASYEINFKLGKNKMNPVIEIQMNPSTAAYAAVQNLNYMKLEGTGRKTRYYFIDKVETTRTGLTRFNCREDVLMTWNSEIKALTATLDRSETIFNGYLPDSDYNAKGYRAIVAKEFPQGLTTDSYILITTG